MSKWSKYSSRHVELPGGYVQLLEEEIEHLECLLEQYEFSKKADHECSSKIEKELREENEFLAREINSIIKKRDRMYIFSCIAIVIIYLFR
ncbi:MAG TPA: hypothetical protein VIZ65_02770 [Cellvibrionaceae bacterium]